MPTPSNDIKTAVDGAGVLALIVVAIIGYGVYSLVGGWLDGKRTVDPAIIESASPCVKQALSISKQGPKTKQNAFEAANTLCKQTK